MLSATFDPAYSFGSEAANLEYSILSAILGNPSPPDSATSPPPPAPSHYSSWPSESIDFAQSPPMGASGYGSSFGEPSITMPTSDASLSTSPSSSAHYLTYPYPPRGDELGELPYPSQYQSPQSQTSPHPLQPRYPLDARPRSPPLSTFLQEPTRDAPSRGLISPPPSDASPSSTASVPTGLDTLVVRPRSAGSQLQTINDRVVAPYDYTEGYHFLMKHLPTRCVCC